MVAERLLKAIVLYITYSFLHASRYIVVVDTGVVLVSIETMHGPHPINECMDRWECITREGVRQFLSAYKVMFGPEKE